MDQVEVGAVEKLSGAPCSLDIHLGEGDAHGTVDGEQGQRAGEGGFLGGLEVGGSQFGKGQEELGDIGGFPDGGVVDHLAELIEGREEHICDLGIGDHFPGPQHVEDRLGLVGEILDEREAEECAAALDGMGGAEDLVDELIVPVAAGLLDGQEVRLDRGEMLARLVEKLVQQFVYHGDLLGLASGDIETTHEAHALEQLEDVRRGIDGPDPPIASGHGIRRGDQQTDA